LKKKITAINQLEQFADVFHFGFICCSDQMDF